MKSTGSPDGQPLRAAVIGCGWIGSRRSARDLPGVRSHAEAYVLSPQTELVAFADPEQEVLEDAGRLWGVSRLYAEPRVLFAEVRPDIVSVCTPDVTHAALVRDAVEEGVPAILCEKPLATRVRDASAAARIAARRGTVLAVNYSRRYDPVHRELGERLRRGEFGTIRHVTGWYTRGIVHNGTHLLDTLRLLCGEIAAVQGLHGRPQPDGDGNPDAIVQFTNGASGFLHGCDPVDVTIFEIDLLCSGGRVRLVEQGYRLEVSLPQENGQDVRQRELRPAPAMTETGLRDALRYAVEDTVRAVRTGSPPLCGAEDAIRALELAQAILRDVSRPRAARPVRSA